MTCTVESGIRPDSLYFVREATYGTTPADPDWLRFSDVVQTHNSSPTPTISPRRGIGSPDILAFNAGSESHEFDVTYDMQQWFVTGGTTPLDASMDGIGRDSVGCLLNSHSILEQYTLGDVGAAGFGSKLFVVIQGGKINTVAVEGEPESGDPMTVGLSYMVQKLRAYKIDQPDSVTPGTLEVRSTDAADTTQSVTIESDGAATSEVVGPLTGVTPVATVANFDSIQAALLDAETVGDVIISDGTNDLGTIFGLTSYQNREGDLGVPLLGTGSFEGALGGAYENFLGDTVERPAATALLNGVDISSFNFNVDNGVVAQGSHLTIGKNLFEGPRTVTMGVDVYGPAASYDSMMESLRIVANDIVWTATGGTVTFTGAVLTDGGQRAIESEQAVLTVANTFTAKSITVA